ncbi:MAG TPA: hypothetical protein VGN63_08040 [Flavisolibacter sp.]|nr:hypothetical protein [Flavisolibacter sp.]
MKDRKRIFIINDQVDQSLLLKIYFLRKNCEVSISHSVSEALSRIKEFQPDTIFLASAACRSLEKDIEKIKASAPDAEIIVDN